MDRRNKTPSNKSGRRFFIRPSRTMSRASSMDNNGSGGINGVDDDGTGGNRVFANETEARQWRELGSHVQRLRAVVNGASGSVDGAYEEYRKMSGACGEIYKAVLGGGAGLARVEAGGGGRGVTVEEWVQAVRQWQAGVEGLAKALRNGLVASIALCEGDGAERVFEAMVYDGRVRSQVVNRMRTASLQSIRSKGAGHFDKFLLRLGFYNVVQREVGELTRLVHAAQAAQGRRVETITVWPGGDAVLEFAGDEEEVRRFCVQASMLRAVSGVFAAVLQDRDGQQNGNGQRERDGGDGNGGERVVVVHRMAQRESNRLGALQVLLAAAHRPSEVPRLVAVDVGRAVAECCLRYACTAPLETIVQYSWLPHWEAALATATTDTTTSTTTANNTITTPPTTTTANNANTTTPPSLDSLIDTLLVVSFVFGAQASFARVSRIALLRLTSKPDLDAKPWPPDIKLALWAARAALVAQVHAACAAALAHHAPDPADPSSVRCSLVCDTQHLGWLARALVPLNLLLPSPSSTHSLDHVISRLVSLSPYPHPVHPACDSTARLASQIRQIHASIRGLSLFSVSRTVHGWALSKAHASTPQVLPPPPALAVTDAARVQHQQHQQRPEAPVKVRKEEGDVLKKQGRRADTPHSFEDDAGDSGKDVGA